VGNTHASLRTFRGTSRHATPGIIIYPSLLTSAGLAPHSFSLSGVHFALVRFLGVVYLPSEFENHRFLRRAKVAFAWNILRDQIWEFVYALKCGRIGWDAQLSLFSVDGIFLDQDLSMGYFCHIGRSDLVPEESHDITLI
jgi:hypothetical protein